MNEYQELALFLINREIMQRESDLAGLKATRTKILREAEAESKAR